jgi:hypothetical protein
VKGRNLALLELPGPENPNPVKRDGKIATLFATRKGDNFFEVMGQHIIEYDLYFNTETVDFEKPVTITTQRIRIHGNKLIPGEKKTSYKKKLQKDLAVLLYGYKNFHDPNRLYDARVSILLESTLVLSSPEGQQALIPASLQNEPGIFQGNVKISKGLISRESICPPDNDIPICQRRLSAL